MSSVLFVVFLILQLLFRLINVLQPKAGVKSSTVLRKYLCPLLYDQISAIVVKTLQQDLAMKFVDGFAVTTDHWTSRSGDAYQSLTIHYIDKDYALKKVSCCFSLLSH
jgi:hypothetical protein